jgi:hypothetical protein
MATVNVKVKFSIKDYVNDFMDKATRKKLGDTVVAEAKANIAAGISPVRWEGRFEGYSESYKAAIRRGKKDLKGKTVRPVNLSVTGDLMREYTHEGDENTVRVGFVDASTQNKKLAGYHIGGTENMPSREVVPQPGQEWTVRIQQAIKTIYSERLSAIIKRSNK